MYLFDERVQLWSCFVSSLFQMFLGFVDILFNFLPVHLHIPTVIGNLICRGESGRDYIKSSFCKCLNVLFIMIFLTVTYLLPKCCVHIK